MTYSIDFMASVCVFHLISLCNLLVLQICVLVSNTVFDGYYHIILAFCIFLTECGILSAITCPWAFLITVNAGDAVLPDISIKDEK